uniref:Uncharacterized protein n=1 Tax=Eutreptiella gymnastica TaxID=73025 RepID=A0A7S1NTF5_9EUGL|mmetsp:Transcript_86458/g.150591  ORF Transcript_86458/g.150591 Transcript_86458/m.150591 type:complete len:121 (+) Transcript_86458:214-576(+)
MYPTSQIALWERWAEGLLCMRQARRGSLKGEAAPVRGVNLPRWGPSATPQWTPQIHVWSGLRGAVPSPPGVVCLKPHGRRRTQSQAPLGGLLWVCLRPIGENDMMCEVQSEVAVTGHPTP